MTQRPTLNTERLVLRPFRLGDARDVQRLAGQYEIAANTLLIPYPYEDGLAEIWISSQQEQYNRGKGVVWAITLRQSGDLVGAIGLNMELEHEKAELGYWVGKQYWSRNFATEAAAAVVDYGFRTLKLNRIFARHLSRNPASGRVMQKLGMKYEGHLRHDVKKWGHFEDMELYGLLISDYDTPVA